jgi:signal transduction histidine kinase
MLSPLEVATVIVVAAIAIGGLFLFIRDALQLEQALNLNLTQTLIVSQGIVNLQREIQLTRGEVLRALGNLDDPPKPISRFPFIEIQVNNLTLEAESPSKEYTFTGEALALVQKIENQTAGVKTLISNLQQAQTQDQHTNTLAELDSQLKEMEATVKGLIDLQSTAQREAIIQTRDSLSVSQRTTIAAGAVSLLLSAALIYAFRRGLLLRLQQAVEADRLKSQLLANISHELRTPISAIQGYTQLLNEEAYGALTDKQQATIQRILINTTQLKGMVNNLLDSAQIEQGKLILRNQPFTPANLIETAHSALNILAITKGLSLTSEIAQDVPDSINGDLLRLQQILFNLLSNAIKFTEHGSIHTKIFLPDSSHWALQVTDTGIGISPENQAQVFAAFWQIDSSATREYRGSGLGLSIVKQLANLMRGNLSLTSELGKGSQFTVVFPLEIN